MKASKSNSPSLADLPSLGLGVGVLNTCPSQDTSFFCQFSRFVQIISMILFVGVVIYFIYVFASVYFFKKSRR